MLDGGQPDRTESDDESHAESSEQAADSDDDDFFDVWVYEVNAYNVVFEGMSKLFAEKA